MANIRNLGVGRSAFITEPPRFLAEMPGRHYLDTRRERW